jgi:hypothetical protein
MGITAMKPRSVATALVSLLVLQVVLALPSIGTTTDPLTPAEGGGTTLIDTGPLFAEMGGEDEPVSFVNVSEQAGLADFGGSYFAWGDYNDDTYQDLLVNGKRLLRNSGPPGWTFTDVTSTTGLDRTTGVNVGIWGDYDNDGDLDVYLAGGGWTTSEPTRNDYLFRNEGAPDWNFTDVTTEAGGVVDDYPSVAAAWGDINNDGFLDLYVANYENSNYGGWPDTLWINDGDGHFADVSVGRGIRSAGNEPGRGVAFCDYDDDGDQDIYISNYRIRPNILWRNDGTGRFTNVASAAGVTGDPHMYQGSGPYYGHTIGASWADWNNDGYMDLWEANLVHKYVGGGDIRGYICDDSKFYKNNGPSSGWTFTDVRSDTGIATKPVGSGANIRDELYDGIAWADFDNDGDLDVYMPQVYNLNYAYSFLYINRGDGSFEDVGPDYGLRVWNTYGAAWADYDNDGDLDLATGGKSPMGAPSRIHLFRNSGNSNNWLKVAMDSTTSINSMGLGTRISVTVGNTTMTREIEGGTGSHAQMNDLPVEFGLGRALKADTVVVRFPTGNEATFLNVSANQTFRISEVDGGTVPVLEADPTSPYEDGEVLLTTNAASVSGVDYSGYYWDADGDNVFEAHTDNGYIPHVWTTWGEKTPRVAVARVDGGISFLVRSSTTVVDVRNKLPVADAGEDIVMIEDETGLLNGSASNDTPSDRPLLEFKWVVDGDDRGWSPDPTVQVMWTEKGVYHAELFVRDDDGALASDSIEITVTNSIPIVENPGPMETHEDEEVIIRINATDTPSDVDGLVYRFQFGDGNSTGWILGTQQTYVYRTSGTMQVRVDAKDTDGGMGSTYFDIVVHNVLPTCQISIQVAELEEDEEFKVFGTVDDSVSDSESLRWMFDFGDGTMTDWRRKPVQRITHSFVSSGTFDVTLLVMDDDSAQSSSSSPIVVENVAPSIVLMGPAKPVDEDERVHLSAEATDTDSDLPTLSYRWDMGDGTVTPWGTELQMDYVYTSKGTYVVNVTVLDDDGVEFEAQFPVKVENLPPRAEAIQGKARVSEDEEVTFDAGGSTDTPSDLDGLTYTWTSGDSERTGMQATFKWTEPGNHNVVLTVTDDDGAMDEIFMQVVVTNEPPQGQAVVDRTEAKVGQTLTFSVLGLHDTPSDLPDLLVTWAFGDGTMDVGSEVTHAFDEGGDYTVIVTIKDDNGAKVDRFVTVTIEEEEVGIVGGSGTLIGIGIAAAIAIVLALLYILRVRARGDEGLGPIGEDDVAEIQDDVVDGPSEDHDEAMTDGPGDENGEPSDRDDPGDEDSPGQH